MNDDPGAINEWLGVALALLLAAAAWIIFH